MTVATPLDLRRIKNQNASRSSRRYINAGGLPRRMLIASSETAMDRCDAWIE